ncbi:MAG: transcription antitermination factor NusB [Candidatus Omnitrophica bacterium]|nr:transcription antitermination factor NusB [Candidatus Omnitrophota bacterium]
MRKRTLARENALKILYQADILRRDINLVSASYWQQYEANDPLVKEFCDRITYGVNFNIGGINEMITKYATNWQLKRMAVIDRNVMRLGAFELLFAPDIPPKVTINECIELAKKYGDVESSKFVNGILDKIHKNEISQEGKAINEQSG